MVPPVNGNNGWKADVPSKAWLTRRSADSRPSRPSLGNGEVRPEIDIWRAAQLMLKRYGHRPPRTRREEPTARANELALAGDANGLAGRGRAPGSEAPAEWFFVSLRLPEFAQGRFAQRARCEHENEGHHLIIETRYRCYIQL